MCYLIGVERPLPIGCGFGGHDGLPALPLAKYDLVAQRAAEALGDDVLINDRHFLIFSPSFLIYLVDLGYTWSSHVHRENICEILILLSLLSIVHCHIRPSPYR